MSTNITERGIQKILYQGYLSGDFEYFCRNIKLFGWEHDFFAIKKSGMSYEFEIKTSRTDFRADKNKITKHNRLRSYHAKTKGKVPLKQTASTNFFYYVVPANLINKNEVPSYAGLIYIFNAHSPKTAKVRIVKRAPILHKTKKNTGQILRKLLKSIMYRFHDNL